MIHIFASPELVAFTKCFLMVMFWGSIMVLVVWAIGDFSRHMSKHRSMYDRRAAGSGGRRLTDKRRLAAMQVARR